VWDSDHPYMEHGWVPGCSIGYEHTFIRTVADFLVGLEQGEKTCPDFADAQYMQLVCDSVLRSTREQRWEEIPR
jgi:hypothetical protein